jgi:hypothetical protein
VTLPTYATACKPVTGVIAPASTVTEPTLPVASTPVTLKLASAATVTEPTKPVAARPIKSTSWPGSTTITPSTAVASTPVSVTSAVPFTPTNTGTPTQTPTPTQTVTPTNTGTPTQTPTPSITPSSTPSVGTAYLFIEPQSGSTNIGQYMFDGGYNFYGFTNLSGPDTSSQVLFSNDMNGYVSFTGWTGGVFPTVRTQSVPQVSGGVDAFGNSIVAYNFTTHEVPLNTVSNQAWYTWIIPTGATNNLIQYQIDVNSFGNPNSMTTLIMDSTIYTKTFNYTGSTIPTGVYRVYTTFADLSFYLDNGGNTIYFRGNSVI